MKLLFIFFILTFVVSAQSKIMTDEKMPKTGADPDIEENKIVAAYDRAKFLDERKKMMQEWADYVDSLMC